MSLQRILGLTITILAAARVGALDQDAAVTLGPTPETQIQEPAAGEFCEGATLVQWDDNTFENGIAWGDAGVLEEGLYGSWAECYEGEFVCGIQFLFAQVEGYTGQTMNVYVWDAIAGPTPGNVKCVVAGVDPGPPAVWPDISTHNVLVCCQTVGLHFSGFWPDWPGSDPGWFVVTDENGPGNGCPRTNIAPGIGYPTGWQHPNIVPAFENTQDLGIREYSGMGLDCAANPTRRETWGAIKALY